MTRANEASWQKLRSPSNAAGLNLKPGQPRVDEGLPALSYYHRGDKIALSQPCERPAATGCWASYLGQAFLPLVRSTAPAYQTLPVMPLIEALGMTAARSCCCCGSVGGGEWCCVWWWLAVVVTVLLVLLMVVKGFVDGSGVALVAIVFLMMVVLFVVGVG